jgi:hypothetical protein
MRTRTGVIAAVLAVVALAGAMLVWGGGQSGAAQLTRGQIAEEAGFEGGGSTTWHLEECVIEHIFTTREQVVTARNRERRRDTPDGPDPGGIVVSAYHERFGVELGHEYFYCQQEVEERLAHVGHGGVPEGTPTTVTNARAAIEALELPIRLEEPGGENGVLVGRVHGGLGERFAFFLFVNRSAPRKMPGVAGYPGFGEGRNKGGLLGGGLVDGYIFGSREIARRGETGEQFKQQSNIELEVTEALCMQATGEDCGI